MVVVLALVACLGFCIYRKCFNKAKKPKKARERTAGRGRRKKEKEGEEAEDKKVRTGFCSGPEPKQDEEESGMRQQLFGLAWTKHLYVGV